MNPSYLNDLLCQADALLEETAEKSFSIFLSDRDLRKRVISKLSNICSNLEDLPYQSASVKSALASSSLDVAGLACRGSLYKIPFVILDSQMVWIDATTKMLVLSKALAESLKLNSAA